MYKRPVLIFGWGIHLAGAEEEAVSFAERSGIPVCLTWGAADLMPYDHPLRIGTFGTHGNRFANFAIQNADQIISVGSRLDTKATGAPPSSFAPKAEITMVDIDYAEIMKFRELGRKVHGVVADAKQWLTAYPAESGDYTPWLERINGWKAKYPVPDVGPYAVVKQLSHELLPGDVIVSDTGCSLGWMMQAFKFKKWQRYFHAFNNTPMGYGLPAAVGAAFATNKRVVLITGDGGFAVNITELATVARHALPIKIVLFNNRGHAMCRQTQRQWLGGEYPSTSFEGGLACPDYVEIAAAYGLYSARYEDAFDLEYAFRGKQASFLEFAVDPEQGIEGQVRFGKSLEDADPALPREELAEIMA